MSIILWNCRGLGDPSTIPQLESIRLNLPALVFVCETKQESNFITTVCMNLKFAKRWDVVELLGKKGGMLVAWSEEVQIKQIKKNDFCYKLLTRRC